MPLPGRLRAGQHGDRAVLLEPAPSRGPARCCRTPRYRSQARCRAACPPSSIARARFLKPAQSRDLLRARHVRGEVAGIVGLAGLRRVGHRLRLDEVLAPQRVGREPELARRDVDQALDHIGRLRPAGAAIGIDRHRVGVDAADADVAGRDVVDAGQHAGADERNERRIGRRDTRPCRRRGRPRARGSDCCSSSASLAVVTLSRPCASPRKCSLRSATHLHRPAQPLRRHRRQRVLAIGEQLGAEAAADIRRHHPQLVGRDLQDARTGRRAPRGCPGSTASA